MIKAVFWDNDGVLVDTERLYFQATAEVLRKAGIDLTEDLFRRISLTEGRSAFDLAKEEGLDDGLIEDLQQERNELYTALLARGVPVMEGVRETLARLFGRFLMAVVTSCRRPHFEVMHRRTGLLDFFDFVLVREDYGRSKPDAEPYLAALSRSGLSPDECLVVEDSPRGLAAARAAGIRCLVIPNELTRGSDFAGAWRVLSDCRAVPEVIDSLNGKGRP